LNEGKVRGVSVSGVFYYNDGTTSNFKGVVTPSTPVNTNQDINKTNKVGVQKYRALTEWVK
ncbi:dispersin Aap, partial [Escherichia coli]